MALNPWDRLHGLHPHRSGDTSFPPQNKPALRDEQLFVSDEFQLFYIVGHSQTLCRTFNEFSAEQAQTLRQKAASEESNVTFTLDEKNGELMVRDNILNTCACVAVSRFNESVQDKPCDRPENPWSIT